MKKDIQDICKKWEIKIEATNNCFWEKSTERWRLKYKYD
jgi:hypothetical protein